MLLLENGRGHGSDDRNHDLLPGHRQDDKQVSANGRRQADYGLLTENLVKRQTSPLRLLRHASLAWRASPQQRQSVL